MAKADKHYIDAARFETVILAAGLSVNMQAGFVQVEAKKGRKLYVAKTKRVGRVDLSGFTADEKTFGVMPHTNGKFGAVEQELDFRKVEGESDEDGEKRILGNFELLIEHMKGLPERETVKKGAAAKGESKPKPSGWSGTKGESKAKAAGTTSGTVSNDPKAEVKEKAKALVETLNRGAQIAAESKKRNMPVSKKAKDKREATLGELHALLDANELKLEDLGFTLEVVDFGEEAPAAPAAEATAQ